MKKIIHFPLLFFLFFGLFAQAGERYWVGGTGVWNDSRHWSLLSGGRGGAAVPTENDNVYFDGFSFNANGQQVTIKGEAACLGMYWKNVRFSPSLAGDADSRLTVFSSIELTAGINNEFKGSIHFASTHKDNILHSAKVVFKGDIYFDGEEGYWTLDDDLVLDKNASVYLVRGTLNTNSKTLHCSSFYGSGKNKRGLIPGDSRLIVENYWDLEDGTELTFSEGGNYSLQFVNKIMGQFKSGNFSYNKIELPAAVCPPLTVTTTTTPDSCNPPPPNGTATANPSGGTPPYTYLWTPGGQTTQTATGLGPGGYIVTVTDALGNQCSETAQVTQPPPIIINLTSTVQPLCNGQCNGSLTVSPVGGVSPYTYSWAPTGQSTPSATGLCAGTYTVTVTDSYNCTRTRTIVLNQPSLLVANGVTNNVLCNGQCTGSMSVSPTGGTPGYTYSWSPGGATTSSITGLCAGSCYTVTITDANGCTRQYNNCITQPPPITVSTSTTNNPLLCNANCNATATATVGGGVAPYSYSWTPGGQTTATATGLCAGTYTVTVTDANLCTRTAIVIITQPSALTATITTTNNPLLCNGDCNATATVTAGGGTPPYTYSWNTAPSQSTVTATGLCAGTYTVTVTDANLCTRTATITITQPPTIAITISTTNNPLVCFGDCNATATASVTGGVSPYTYTWSTAPSQSTATATGLCAGTYTVTVRDANNCTRTATVTITQPTVISITISTTNNPLNCNSQCNATATATVSGGTPGYTYTWSTAPSQSTVTATGLCAGTYTVTIRDAAGCTRTATVTITQPPLLTVSLTATPILCNMGCTSIISSTVSGGTAPYIYSWAPGNQSTPSITGQCAGTYTLTVTDANACTATATITVTQPTAITLNVASGPASCFGQCNGTASVIAGGGTAPYTYSWTPGGQSTSSITGLCAGTYTVTVTDANGCTRQQTVTITQPTQIQINPTVNNITCNPLCNGSITTAATGGNGPYTYSWQPGNQTTSSITGLCAGSYTVTVTDASGCTRSQVFTITMPPLLTVSITSTTTACNICNGTATVTPSGGTPPYTYSWTTTPTQSAATATGLCPGTYTVFVTDANGCTRSIAATITNTVIIQITSSGNTLSCFGSCNGTACASASGGQAPYSYAWSTTPVQTTQCATGLCAGTYTVTVSDANGCTGRDSITFVNPPQLVASATFTNISCNSACSGTANGSAVGGTGAYSWSWSTGATTQNITGLCAGSYTLTVTDANGCTATTTVTITQAAPIAANPSVTGANCTLCNGSITVAPTGGVPPYTYSWWNNGATTATINNLCPAIYTVTIRDVNGCTSTFTIPLSNINGPTVTLSVNNVPCFGACTGSITSSVSGGTPPYTYTWSTTPSQSTVTATGLCAGTYTVTVRDAPGCVTFATATVTQPSQIVSNAVVVNSSCAAPAPCNGSVTLNPSGGTPGYTYSWLAPLSGSTSSATGLCAGTYSVIVTDANNCTRTFSFTITQPAALNVTINATNLACNSVCTGSATAVPSGGTPPYLYSWLPSGLTTPTIINQCAGTYTVIVTDANGCTRQQTVTITQPTAITLTLAQTNASCFASCNGTATVTPSGGTPPFTYSWNTVPSQTTTTATGLCAGSYTCTVTDANGCTRTQAVTITQPTQILPNAVPTSPSCNGSCNGSATASPTGGAGGPYTYSWNTTPSQSTATAFGLCAGSYTVYVTDVNGCSRSQVVTVTQPLALLANASVQAQPNCPNTCNGSLVSSPLGGTSPYTYSWSTTPAQTTATATGLCAGTYTVYVTDANGCANQQSIALPAPAVLNANPSLTPANCGFCNGSISTSVSGGTSPYTYSWNTTPSQSTATATGLCAGMYNLTVTDANGCTRLFTIGLSNSSGPILTMSSTQVNPCFGNNNGTATVSATGASPFTYSWSTGATTATITGLAAGTYVVQVTDAIGCISTSTVTITQPAQIVPNPVIVNAQCNGICNGTITLGPTGGNGGPYTYSWQPGNQTTASVTGLCPGVYTVTLTDAGGCTRTYSYTVTGTTVITVTATNTNITCSGTCSATATVTNISGGLGPYTYTWSDPSGQFTPTATGLCAGTYTVTIRDANGCTAIATVNVTQTPAVSGSFTVNTAPACGQCNGQVTVTPSGGTAPYTYLWNTGQTTASISNVCAGLYQVVITDANGCSRTINVPVSNASNLASNAVSTNISCFGNCNGTATASPTGGTAPYAYSWIPGNQTTSSISNLCAGTYYVQVIDAAGCIRTDSVRVNGPTQIITNQTVINTACGVCNGSVSLNPSGGAGGPYTYSWQPGNQTTSSVSGLCAGSYTVTITDVSGCSRAVVIAITSTSGPNVTVTTTNINCNGNCNGAANTTVTGGTAPYTYSWSTGATTSSISALCAGNYWVQVTDAAGCRVTKLFTITAPPAIIFSAPIVQNPLCNNQTNGSITVVAAGGTLPFTYSWNPGGATTPTITGLGGGTFTVTVTDANGCTRTLSVTLVNPPALTITNPVITPASCNNTADGAISVTVNGGTPPLTYTWSNGATTQNLNNIFPGVYTLTVTDIRGCTATGTYTVTSIVTVTATITGNTTICLGQCTTLSGTTSVNATGYSWYSMPGMNLIGTGVTTTVCPSTIGNNSYVLIASNGLCTSTATAVVVVNALPTASAGPAVTILMNQSTTIGGSPTGPSGSTYSWWPASGLNSTSIANPTASPTVTTTYYVQVTSSAGCVASDSVRVTVMPEIIFPNGISPNGDGANDEWIIDNIDRFPNCVVEIYNRWGELLFQSVGYPSTDRWKGLYKGKPLPVGTYYYIIDLKSPLFLNAFTGPITLMR